MRMSFEIAIQIPYSHTPILPYFIKMKAINKIVSTAVPLNIENIDTDQIIPARFLKATNRDGFGKNLFRDWRYENDDEKKPKKDFALNDARYSGKILVAG